MLASSCIAFIPQLFLVELLGCVDILTKPNQGGDKRQKAQVANIKLLKTRENATIVLDLVDKTLDKMTLLIEMGIIVVGLFAILSGRNHRRSSLHFNRFEKIFGIVALVRNEKVTRAIRQQVRCLCDIMLLPRCEQESQRIPQRIDLDMNLRAESTLATA